ncbi:hypothetical protein M3P05_15105 [Sansalvadorimonas sp. 2012CJ34-2]|uniref:Uncharacterized protein n=1 Tax=Parendozoicomonas callyspongiae TaxID=2942213 RepID=A0ABT0PIU8_9GAMM|nr:hypothetical protein [Sansalvadorimonas sp. 2012CJ34-2]MCL6271253.1 hypothetical protein [Sansalvadorimonas sp. 2012CJ34-2]
MKIDKKIWIIALVVLQYLPSTQSTAFGFQGFQDRCMEIMDPLSGSNPEIQSYLENLYEESISDGGLSGWIRLQDSMETLRSHADKGSLYKFRGAVVKKFEKIACHVWTVFIKLSLTYRKRM